jgi:TonB family protein
MVIGKARAIFAAAALSLFFCLTSPAFSSQAVATANASGNTQTTIVEHGGVYEVGGDVLPPKVIREVSPKYTRAAKRARLQGVCVLSVIVGTDGRVHHIQVKKQLGKGLDERATKALKKYRFQPATLNGKPVPVLIDIDVWFHIY